MNGKVIGLNKLIIDQLERKKEKKKGFCRKKEDEKEEAGQQKRKLAIGQHTNTHLFKTVTFTITTENELVLYVCENVWHKHNNNNKSLINEMK